MSKVRIIPISDRWCYTEDDPPAAIIENVINLGYLHKRQGNAFYGALAVGLSFEKEDLEEANEVLAVVKPAMERMGLELEDAFTYKTRCYEVWFKPVYSDHDNVRNMKAALSYAGFKGHESWGFIEYWRDDVYKEFHNDSFR